MRTLRDLQADLRQALLAGGGGSTALADEILPDGLAVEGRIALYRHHVLTTLTAALADTFPVVRRLVGAGFFAYAADTYVRREPPEAPCLSEYGAGFAAFLAEFPACRDLVYLADVARLEWAMNVALHAEDARPIDPAALRVIAPEATGGLTFRFDPSVTLLASPWPIDAIWRANQPDADPEAAVDLASAGVHLEVRRREDDVVFRPLPPLVHALRAALAAGRTLEQATADALAIDAGLDLASALHALLDEGLVVAVEAAASAGQPS